MTTGYPAAGHSDHLPGVILAGGRSSRMGSDKSARLLGGVSLLQHVIERFAPQTSIIGVNSNIIDKLDFAPTIAVFADTVPGHVGPMAGVLAAMRQARAQTPTASHVATVPTDTPFFPSDLVVRLQAAIREPDEIAVAFSGETMHPVFALWPIALADALETWLITDEKRRVRSFIERHPMAAVTFAPLDTADGPIDPFFNINTPADLETAERWLPLIRESER
ncbi:MAG TPA: molybdenum cofactor guanylyltransferase MobA [Pararhizobium sp.]|uniref:molybdenum cofactor guanylyltransferase MobA n=1 Tax=Pararhizobium sp. TaxID=1977563 RepID=UPI002BE6384C|nr:molybdenum cofactor guanylyltransferase MobA [Pararhizobium sp.]HTO32500.1 molybdenum cofactor guanylyltransferase MobA [Pararhizobium sp.]